MSAPGPTKQLPIKLIAALTVVAALLGALLGSVILGGSRASPPGVIQCLPRVRIAKAHHRSTAHHFPKACRTIVPMWAAGDRLTNRPYFYGGGHGVSRKILVSAYDCSSSLSYIAYYGGLINATTNFTSGDYSPGNPNILVHGTLQLGPGRYITFWSNPGHVFAEVNGRWWDDGTHAGWFSYQPQSTLGFVASHPPGL